MSDGNRDLLLAVSNLENQVEISRARIAGLIRENDDLRNRSRGFWEAFNNARSENRKQYGDHELKMQRIAEVLKS